jgi:hypothetical protein
MTDLYPEPPHLSAFVAPALDQSEALLVAWEVLTAAGCAFGGDVLVARDHEWFRDVSDVDREVVHHRGSPRDLLATRGALRIQFRHRSMGTVALGLSSAADFGEPHPLEVVIYAGPLSFPVEIWSRPDRQAAKRVLGWMERLLLALAEQTQAQYGAIGIEATFPTPAALARAQRSALWPTTWFWSSQLGSCADAEEKELVTSLDQSAVTRSKEGTLFRAWRPWTEPRIDEPSLDRVVGFLSRAVRTQR